jgi:hypothetical protein
MSIDEYDSMTFGFSRILVTLKYCTLHTRLQKAGRGKSSSY